MQVVVEAGALAPLRDYGQLGLGGVAHEQQDVHMTGFPDDGEKDGTVSE